MRVDAAERGVGVRWTNVACHVEDWVGTTLHFDIEATPDRRHRAAFPSRRPDAAARVLQRLQERLGPLHPEPQVPTSRPASETRTSRRRTSPAARHGRSAASRRTPGEILVVMSAARSGAAARCSPTRATPRTPSLRALADPHRRQILRLVRGGELAAGEIASHFDATQQAVSHHLQVLAKAGLLSERRDGVRRLYALDPQAPRPGPRGAVRAMAVGAGAAEVRRRAGSAEERRAEESRSQAVTGAEVLTATRTDQLRRPPTSSPTSPIRP